MNYRGLKLKKPIETVDYDTISSKLIKRINEMVMDRFKAKKNKIVLRTNIFGSFPLANINHIAGPLVESWADNVFRYFFHSKNNPFSLIHMKVGLKRTDLADVKLQFHIGSDYAEANVDVKSTVDDIIKKSGRSPNITSFAKIRTAYVKDPDFLYIILSIKYESYSKTDKEGHAVGILQMTSFHTFDFKKMSKDDFDINPALGTGQIQVKDIHYISTVKRRSTWQLIQLLDDKYVHSKKHDFSTWLREAKRNKWLK